MENPVVLALYFLESFCVTALGGVLFGYFSQQNVKSIVKIGLLNGLFLYLIRNIVSFLGYPIIVHMPFTMIFLFILIWKFANVDKLIAILSVILGYVVVLFNESTVVTYYLIKFNIPTEQIATNTLLHFQLGILNDLPFILIIGIAYYFKKYKKGKVLDVKEIGIKIK